MSKVARQPKSAPVDTQEAQERAAKPDAKPKPFEFDLASGGFVVRDKFGEFGSTIMGLPNQVLWRLAIHGAMSLLRGRKNRAKLWDSIRQDRFERKRNKYPITVQAYANVKGVPVDEAMKEWHSLSTEDKYQIRELPQVRMECARLQGGDKPL